MATTSGRVDRRERLRRQTRVLNSPGWVQATETLFKTPRNESKSTGRRTTMFTAEASLRRTRRQTMLTHEPLFEMDIDAPGLRVLEVNGGDLADSGDKYAPSSTHSDAISEGGDAESKASGLSAAAAGVATSCVRETAVKTNLKSESASVLSNLQTKIAKQGRASKTKDISERKTTRQEAKVKIVGGNTLRPKKERKTKKAANSKRRNSDDEVERNFTDKNIEGLPVGLKMSGTPVLRLKRVNPGEQMVANDDENVEPGDYPLMGTDADRNDESLNELDHLANMNESFLNSSQAANSSQRCFIL